MAAFDLRAALRAHKVCVWLDGEDTVVRFWAPGAIPADLLAEARSRKAEMRALLRAEVETGPPSGAQLFFYDEHGRACGPEEAYAWTWERGPRWVHTAGHPVPP